MRVTTGNLRQATAQLLEHLEKTGQAEFSVEEDFYWSIPEGDRYDPYNEPKKLTLGQLSDDWAEVQSIVDGSRAPVGYALVWLAAVLRRIGEKSR